MASDELETIEIVEADIIDSTVEVGSGCIWRGSGKEPQWDNPKSTKAYDHIIRHHGSKLKSSNLQGRAASNNKAQGQWLNDRDWIIAEKLIPKYYGQYTIKFHRPIGRVYHPDGRITENVCYVQIGRNVDGTIKYAYPIVKPYIKNN
ncbi:MAG TPA: hypothetical protein DEG17_00990 [Cyanobacteria bacterium UBA11149]|nr:hypothetical protein [Cyanobacteria bacterium UBA11367]HBE59083.1 hypothetical protein [Cyanobacteria bacterium UBA11366]HBK64131.1 hypothetical protein [Cyanobacteria bacterium UBA11166]HBR72763.1 hypothetical protein [Cyanobacteria bacterium UBA11159]HBS67941.1 hypothetical protein [Cyanobacteria bacterium UBA11153]HBW87489.1 hypothetical protein [Cyanobacteria bacterium UBA11149]HCA94049.1 hypothetical protein [Cyanobacteria bacterium UBA9226]